MASRLPVYIARCEPSMPCPQANRCARYLVDADEFHDEIDASPCVDSHGCTLFIDQGSRARVAQAAPRPVVALPQVPARGRDASDPRKTGIAL